jgi:hypothetical protein
MLEIIFSSSLSGHFRAKKLLHLFNKAVLLKNTEC